MRDSRRSLPAVQDGRDTGLSESRNPKSQIPNLNSQIPSPKSGPPVARPDAETPSNLERALRSGRALISYLTASDPSDEAFLEAAFGAVEGGAGALEIGIPFSDPVADGPVIQAAHHRALAAGGGAKRTLELVRCFRRKCAVPVVLFTYLNPVLAFGLDRFALEASEAGADGVLLLDLPPREEPSLLEPLVRNGLDPVVLVSPNTTRRRAEEIVRHGRGFVYLVSRTGITGTHGGAGADLAGRVAQLREMTDLPVAVGFGVKSRSDAEAIWSVAEGVVVGSALIARLAEPGAESPGNRARRFMEELRHGALTSHSEEGALS
jgi:tryptophan synthase alpha chain